MSQVAKCTSCEREVTIPEGVEPFESVRCPHCEAEYALVAVLFNAQPGDEAPQPPPQLVPLASGSQQDQPEAEAAGEAPADATEQPDPDQASSDEAEPPEEETETPGDEPEPPEEEVETPGDEPERPEEEAETPGDETADTVDESDEAAEAEEPTDVPQPPEDQAADEEGEAPEDAAEGADEEGETPDEEVARADEESEAAEEEAEADEEEDQTETPVAETTPDADQEKVVAVRCPHCEAEYPLCDVIVVETGDALGSGAAAAAARALLGGEADGSQAPTLDVWAKAEGMPQIDLGDGGGPQAIAADAAAFDFAAEDAEAETDEEGKPRPRRRRRQKSGVRTAAGIVLGGLGGVLIAYYAINWLRPETGNFLHIPLPGLPHTYKYSPDWFPGFLRPDSVSEESLEALEGMKDALEDALADFEKPEAPPQRKTEDRAPHRKRPPPSDDTDATNSSRFGSAVPKTKPKARPKRKTLPEGYVGLRAPPSYSSDELSEALKAASEGLENSGGEISREVYQKTCRLAEVMTFVDGNGGARAAGPPRSAVRKLVEQMGEDQANLDKIGFQAGALCVDQDRRGNGILLAGKVAKLISEGKAHGAHVELAASAKAVLVVGKRPLPAEADDSVLILGSIVDNPVEDLVGFPTEQRLVIWAGLTVKVEE